LIPCLFANKVSAALSEFIFTGYEPETAPFKGKSERLEEEQEDDKAFIKGPHAYLAQVWQRLPTDNQSTNLLTATGETEWFLYPVLDHCQRTGSRGRPDAALLWPKVSKVRLMAVESRALDVSKIMCIGSLVRLRQECRFSGVHVGASRRLRFAKPRTRLLYAIERKIKALSTEERYRIRQELSVPAISSPAHALLHTVTPESLTE
jgi:hypothetical protein